MPVKVIHRHPMPPLGRIRQLHQAAEEAGPCRFCGKPMGEWQPGEECRTKMVAVTLLEVMGGAGPYRLRYTFKRDGAIKTPIRALFCLAEGGMIRLPIAAQAANLLAVKETGDWGSDANRTVTIELAPTLDWQMFLDWMSDACQSISAA